MEGKNKMTKEKKDPDWMYKSILGGKFGKPEETDKDVCGNGDGW